MGVKETRQLWTRRLRGEGAGEDGGRAHGHACAHACACTQHLATGKRHPSPRPAPQLRLCLGFPAGSSQGWTRARLAAPSPPPPFPPITVPTPQTQPCRPHRSVTSAPAPATTVSGIAGAAVTTPAQSPQQAAAPGRAAAAHGPPTPAARPPWPCRCSGSQRRWDISHGAQTQGRHGPPSPGSTRCPPSWGAETMFGEGDLPPPATRWSPAPCPGQAGPFPSFPPLRP